MSSMDRLFDMRAHEGDREKAVILAGVRSEDSGPDRSSEGLLSPGIGLLAGSPVG